MPTKLLMSTAALALMLAGPVAYAQSNPDKKPEAAKEQTQAKPSEQKRTEKAEEKAAKSDQTKGMANPSERQKQEKASSSEQQPPQQKSSATKNPQQKAAEQQNAPKQSSQRNASDTKKQSNKSAGTTSKSTTGQGTSEPQRSTTNGQPQQTSPTATQQQNSTNRQSTSTSDPGSKRAQQNTSGSNAQLPRDKQTRISETISHSRDVAQPVRNLNVTVNIGTRVPDRVSLHRLPSEIVTIEPAYRDYEYFMTDEDIVIVNPRSRQVVTMISRNESGARAEASSTQVSTVSGGGALPCQVVRREASGQSVPVNPSDLLRSTTGAGSHDSNRLAVTVQAPNGQTMPPIELRDETGQIVVATDGHDCKISIEPGMH